MTKVSKEVHLKFIYHFYSVELQYQYKEQENNKIYNRVVDDHMFLSAIWGLLHEE